MKEWIVVTDEARRYRVEYIFRARSAEEAREMARSLESADVVSEYAEMESVIDLEVISVEETK